MPKSFLHKLPFTHVGLSFFFIDSYSFKNVRTSRAFTVTRYTPGGQSETSTSTFSELFLWSYTVWPKRLVTIKLVIFSDEVTVSDVVTGLGYNRIIFFWTLTLFTPSYT